MKSLTPIHDTYPLSLLNIDFERSVMLLIICEVFGSNKIPPEYCNMGCQISNGGIIRQKIEQHFKN